MAGYFKPAENFFVRLKKQLDFYPRLWYNLDCAVYLAAGVAEWQTHQIQVLAPSRVCEFKSHLPHQHKIPLIYCGKYQGDFFCSPKLHKKYTI